MSSRDAILYQFAKRGAARGALAQEIVQQLRDADWQLSEPEGRWRMRPAHILRLIDIARNAIDGEQRRRRRKRWR
jgi:hypothetical protein